MKTQYSDELKKIDSPLLLRAMSSPGWMRKPENLPKLRLINGANKEIDQMGEVGLTVKFDALKTLVTSEGLSEWFGESGEFYIITTAMDGSGRPLEYQTQYFQGIKRDDHFPLGDGGMLVSVMRNPRWFVDLHMIIMESDSDMRNIGRYINEAKSAAQMDEIMDMMANISTFDPTMISRYICGINLFLTALSGILTENGDDHIATIHDFYLKHQQFGAGRHPDVGLKNFQNVEAAYTIDLSPIGRQ